MPSPWFPGAVFDPADEPFLAALRSWTGSSGLVDASPEHTTLVSWEGAVIALVEMPGLQDSVARPTLEVIWNGGHSYDLMCGIETYGYLADSYEEMELGGEAELEPEELARHAHDWFVGQLRRPVEQVTWSTWRGERSLVRFADDGEELWSDVWGRRRERRRPARMERRRPGTV